jgi:hypothetical protein
MVTGDAPLPNVPSDAPGGDVGAHGCSPRARRLARIVEMLSRDPCVRTELVDDLRGQVATGGYVTEQKLDLAIHRLLKDILR